MLGKAGGRRNADCEFSVKLAMNVVISSDREDVFLTGFPLFSLGLSRKTDKRLVNYL